MGQDFKKLADKIARLLESEPQHGETAAIFAALEKINHRLDKLEKFSITMTNTPLFNHSSLDKFSIAEAVADAVIGAKPNEKACTFEPNGKPCDHCSMCSSRGF